MQPEHVLEAYLASASARPHAPWTRLTSATRGADAQVESAWRLEVDPRGASAASLHGDLRVRLAMDVVSVSFVVFEPSGLDAAIAAGELVALLNGRRPLGCWYLDDAGHVAMRHALAWGSAELSEDLVHDLVVATLQEATLWHNAFHLVCAEGMAPDHALGLIDRL